MQGYRLSVDYGTSNTVALLQWPDGRRRQLLFDGSPLLPSAVYANDAGAATPLATGRDAERLARADPARFEPNPKRHVDAQELLLGEGVFTTVNVIAATLRRAHAEACRVGTQPPETVVLTCPAGWGATRRTILTEAANQAGMPCPTLVTEPVAAATYFTTAAHDCPVGRCLVVYDLGAGTFDVSVVRRTADGFVVLAVDGCDDTGGLDLDAIIVDHVARSFAQSAPDAWQRLTSPTTTEERRHFRTFWEDARGTKELLSRHPSAPLYVPLVNQDTVVTREEFEQAATPLVQRTVDVTARAIAVARVSAEDLAGVFLVGGASRTPLVATMLHRRLGVAPTVLEQPETVVAEGALTATDAATRGQVPPGPVPSEPSSPERARPATAATVPARPPTPSMITPDAPVSWPAMAETLAPSVAGPPGVQVTPWSARWWLRWSLVLAASGLVSLVTASWWWW